jgi:hypothetical protein
VTIAIPPEYRDKPLIGVQVPWKQIEGQVLRVNRFMSLVADVDRDMKRHRWAWSWAWMELYESEQSGPYTPLVRRLQFRKRLFALLEVECPGKLNEPSYMPVCHRFDFVKLWTICGVEDNLDPDEEVLLGYPLPCDTRWGSVFRAFLPQLQVYVYTRGSLEVLYGRHKLDREWVLQRLQSEHSRTPRYLRQKQAAEGQQ